MEKLLTLIGKRVQVASDWETVEGVLVSVDRTKATIRTSGISGYENGQYAIVLIPMISFVRIME